MSPLDQMLAARRLAQQAKARALVWACVRFVGMVAVVAMGLAFAGAFAWAIAEGWE